MQKWLRFVNLAGCGLIGFLLLSCAAIQTNAQSSAQTYPEHWWTPVTDPNVPKWEILPQAALPGEVILSKRNELGLLSNFTETPFTFRGVGYKSIEGFWQMMLYPEGPSDPRSKLEFNHWNTTREQVSQMVAFEAKKAGARAEKNLESLGIDWVSFEGRRFVYRTPERGEHYRWIRAAMVAKLQQNESVLKVLLATGNLKLRPDHHTEPNSPPAWQYFQIWTELREQLRGGIALNNIR
jgi:hypothetical protein